MWLWWWARARVAFYGAGMAGNTSKVDARRRAREALARMNEARAQRERASVDDAATFTLRWARSPKSMRGSLSGWRWSANTCELRRAGDAPTAERKRVAIARMQQRGETLVTIAELTGMGIGEIRAMLRYAPKLERHAASGSSAAPVRDAGGGQVSTRLHAGGSAALGDAAAV